MKQLFLRNLMNFKGPYGKYRNIFFGRWSLFIFRWMDAHHTAICLMWKWQKSAAVEISPLILHTTMINVLNWHECTRLIGISVCKGRSNYKWTDTSPIWYYKIWNSVALFKKWIFRHYRNRHRISWLIRSSSSWGDQIDWARIRLHSDRLRASWPDVTQ